MDLQLAAGTSGEAISQHAAKAQLPLYPGVDVHAHAGQEWIESVEAKLAGIGLLAVARGQLPAEALVITDMDMEQLPSLPVDHRDYNRREEARLKAQTQNEVNEKRRDLLTYRSWTELYSLLKECTTSDLMLSRLLMEECDLAKQGHEGGFYDGPRAWKILLTKLAEARTTERHEEFYRRALRLQMDNHLVDGCLGSEYSKKALAFLNHIRPYTMQSYSDEGRHVEVYHRSDAEGAARERAPHHERAQGRGTLPRPHACHPMLSHARAGGAEGAGSVACSRRARRC